MDASTSHARGYRRITHVRRVLLLWGITYRTMDIEQTLIAQGFTKYRHEPTGFEGWSRQDLCTVDAGCKDWFIA